jgi:uncharacterized membrane protein YhaH (DUF805 family)
MTGHESTNPIHCYLDGFRHYVDFRGRTGRRGYWYFFLVPFVGTIVLLVFLATEGTRGDNGHGPAPRLATDS